MCRTADYQNKTPAEVISLTQQLPLKFASVWGNPWAGTFFFSVDSLIGRSLQFFFRVGFILFLVKRTTCVIVCNNSAASQSSWCWSLYCLFRMIRTRDGGMWHVTSINIREKIRSLEFFTRFLLFCSRASGQGLCCGTKDNIGVWAGSAVEWLWAGTVI